ncbi:MULTISPECIES: biotin--[acetyl-CoA-carboxylase] ligase [Clostridium]|uniref:Bifunctional ligase/repressor BirA n=1 Tax=Clostridium cibarium TaxID=2762247 RepID=A0ABR8PWI4_9CLOT|nr:MULTISPECIES: biotin--[acetyl-CoA-carboxylase] ligase [Clostridium]MBD7912551.1 biotin--[acetyl-CoA-carboxylase] ligase [Clostridium cibarium]
MEEKILAELKKAKDYISGETLSSNLMISRAAIWKHIKNLKAKGYVIEGVSNKGYKLVSTPDIISPNDVLESLTTSNLWNDIIHFDTIDSTNKKAKELASKGAKDGTVIISEIQEAGNGRFKRIWSSPKGGIWFSLILRPNIIPTECPKITQITAAAMHKTLCNLGGNLEIKWPNDIILNDKKLCGILTELKCDLETVDYLIVGIGLNVNIDNFDDEICSIATSLKLELGKHFNRAEILSSFLINFERLYTHFITNGDISETITICRDNSNLFDKKARLITCNTEESVTCLRLSDDGTLIIKDTFGNERAVLSGEITFK